MAYCMDHDQVYSDGADDCPICRGEQMVDMPVLNPWLKDRPLRPITDETSLLYLFYGHWLKLTNPQIFL